MSNPPSPRDLGVATSPPTSPVEVKVKVSEHVLEENIMLKKENAHLRTELAQLQQIHSDWLGFWHNQVNDFLLSQLLPKFQWLICVEILVSLRSYSCTIRFPGPLL